MTIPRRLGQDEIAGMVPRTSIDQPRVNSQENLYHCVARAATQRTATGVYMLRSGGRCD
jgi:hypothetical protein